MITPPYLKPGDKIGIVAPARKIELSEISFAIEVFESWGLKVELGKNIFKTDRQFAGTEKERADDFQYMIDNPEIKAILCARGGYGSIKMVKHIHFENLIKNPKWIVGYSDITVLHAIINEKLKMKTIHGIMPFNINTENKEDDSVISLKKVLFGNKITYNINGDILNKPGITSGILIGGNLSVLYSLAGTKYEYDYSDKILLIEDLDEYLYHIDRMMMNLKYSGKLQNLKGLIVGGMTEMHDNQVPFGKSAYEIISESVREYNFPVCFNFPVGHQKENRALTFGSKINLTVSLKEAKVLFTD
ncbi:MAG: LD-carboxypeptidase [Bacteroidetes bacterium GWA2_31_9b]|nr:MAG: LD-carboxypeptidase [Bacteroidetes bacterium GWA2_31_9b]